MTGPERLLRSHTLEAVEDPASDIVWAGEYEGRWGIRMAQESRDFTTVWFDSGQRTVRFEAYVVGRPPAGGGEEVFRQCLTRNWDTLFARFALDRRGDLFICGRLPNELVTIDSLDTAIGEIYGLIEVAFRPILRAISREKNA